MTSPAPRRRARLLPVLLPVLLTALLTVPLTVLVTTPAPAQADDRPGAAGPVVPTSPGGPAGPTLTPAGAGDAALADQPLTPGGYRAGTYVVLLRDPAAADYRGGLAGLRSTSVNGRFSPRSARTRAYTSHLGETQREVAGSVQVTPLASYRLTTNGFAARLSGPQAARLSTDPRVKAVVRSELLHVEDASTSTGYLGLEGYDGVWAGLGGPAEAGRGVVIGVVDTGIAPENPSFAGAPLGTADGGEPFRDGDAIVFHKSDGTDFRGTCQAGVQFTADDCSQKVVGARYFVAGFGADQIGGTTVGEYLSPRDGESHGSHTASTAAGVHDVATTGGPHVSGVTPAAKIAVYKACWSGPDAASDRDDGCATVDLLAAIEAAVADGVDVINYSIGGGPAETTNSLTDQAFMAAASAGIFVAAAGGNSGPDASTLDNAAPWVTTVAASTFPAPEATVHLGDGRTALGASVTVPAAGVSGSFVYAADAALPGADSPALCGPGTLDPAEVAGAVVLCDRGVVARVAKSAEVKRAGGIGMVLANTTPDSTDVDGHAVPTVHVDAAYAARLHEYAATTGATVRLVPGNSSGDPGPETPEVAGFSSRGPVEADGSDLVKPDVAAPGVNVLAAYANPDGGTPEWGYMSGTSMASPHVAGLAALYLGTKPDAAPAEIKSALMTSAGDTVEADGSRAEDPFAQGNGQVAPSRYLDPGLLYLNDLDDWKGYLAGIDESTESAVAPIDGSDLNLASIGIGALAGRQTVTRTVTATRAGTWTADVTGLPGVTANVEPATLTFAAAGDQQTFTVTFLRGQAPLGEFSTGYLTWTDGDAAVRSSLAVRPVAFDAPAEVAGTGTTGSTDVTVQVGDDAAVDLRAEGLAHGSRVEGTGTAGGRTHRYAVTVPEGATFARFDLEAGDPTGDLDLAVYQVDAASQNVWFVGGSYTDSPGERVDLTGLTPGTYVVEVVFYRAGTGHGADLDYALTSYVVDPAAGDGGFHTTPATLDAAVGDAPTVTAGWSDLAPGAYLGVVHFGDTGVSTVVTVDAGADTPVAPGTPTLTVDPDASGWVARGSDLRVTASGLAPGATYTATTQDGTVLRTGRAPASGRLDWMVTITPDVPAGPNSLTLSGAGSQVSAPFRVTPVKVVDAYVFPWTAFNGEVFARLEISYAGSGELDYRIQSADGSHVYAEDTAEAPGFEGANVWSVTTPWHAVGDDDLVGVVTAVTPEGTDGPSFTTPAQPSDVVEPGTITFTPTAADPDVVEVTAVNHAPTSFPVMVRYHGCDGRYVVAWDSLDLDTSTLRWDLTGMLDVDVVDQFGQVLTTYRNTGPGRCDSAGTAITQDYWTTLTATPRDDPSYDADAPITMEVSNRYAPHSGGFSLSIGEGPTRSSGRQVFSEAIPTEVIDERGPVISRSVSVRAGVPHWAVSNWEEYVDPPGILFFKTSWVEVPALTLDDLTPPPAATPVSPGTVTLHGRAVVGRTLRASPGSWRPGSVTLRYRWLRDSRAIAGATGRTYRLRPADAGHRISVRVTGSLPGATPVSRTSRASGTVLRTLRSTPRPRLVGTPRTGSTLTVRTGTWTPAPVRLTVTWLRDGQVLPGVHGRRYRVRPADLGHRISVAVTGRRAGYLAVVRTSAPRQVR